jgi:hypothetical protein
MKTEFLSVTLRFVRTRTKAKDYLKQKNTGKYKDEKQFIQEAINGYIW